MSHTENKNELSNIAKSKLYDILVNDQPIYSPRIEIPPSSYYRILLVTEGRLSCCIEGATFEMEREEVIFFPPGESGILDMLSDISKTKNTIVKFSPRFLHPTETTQSDVESLFNEPRYTRSYYLFKKDQLETQELRQMMEQVVREYYNKPFGFELALRGDLTRLYIWLVRHCSIHNSKSIEEEENTKKLQLILQYLKENYAYNITIQNVANACGIPYYQFSTLFKRITNKKFSDYLLEMRLNYAKTKLMQCDESISNIAMDCGFEYVSYFIQKFKEKHGVTPKEYRKKNYSFGILDQSKMEDVEEV